MTSIREMTADTEVYRQEISRLIETDPKAYQIYIEMKTELATARQLREMRKSDGLVERAAAKHTHKTK